MYERRSLLLCSSCAVNYYEYCELSASCDCCSPPTGIFGRRLEDTVQYERKLGPRPAPLLVEQCVDFIRERGLSEEGLFRMPGQANLVKDLQEAFDCGDKPLFDSNTDVHTVASLLKLYLRELPEPVIPFQQYQDFITCAQLLSKDEGEGTLELGKQVNTLPQPNYNLLKYICKFLDEVQSHSNENKMSVQNLATVFGPNILRPKMEDPVALMEGTSLIQHLMTVLIREHQRLYTRGDPDPEAPSPGQQLQLQHRSLGAWISEEDLQNSPLALPGVELRSSASSLDAKPGGGASALPAQTQNSVPGAKGSPSAVSPGRPGRSAPSWKYSFKSSSAPRAGPGGCGDGTVADLGGAPSGGGNWLMNGLSSLRGHRRTSSGERSARDSSGSSQRLSTYDNVSSSSPGSGSGASGSGGSSGPWSTSSCEISVSDSAGEPAGPRESGGEWAAERDGCEAEAMELCSSSSDSANTGAGTAPGGAGEDGAAPSVSLSGLVEELKEELRRQKSAYDSRILKLEESSALLGAQLEHLEQEMEQERKKQRMLEIKLRNSERAREDAENRNRLLEKEMEDFFSTLGDLALGARTSNI